MWMKYAAQVMSHTIAASLETLVAVWKLPSSAQNTIDFIDSMNKLFNIFNSQLTNYNNDINEIKLFNYLFKNLSFQNNIFNTMTKYFTNLEVLKYNSVTN